MVIPISVPKSDELEEALLQQSQRNIQRLSLVARFDIIAFNPETKMLQIWARKDSKNQVILNTKADWIIDYHHFFNLAQLVGKVAQLPCTSEESRVPSPWWAIRYI